MGAPLLEYPLLGRIHILNMETWGCVHGRAWHPGRAVVGFLLSGTHTQCVFISLNSISFIFFYRFDLALLPSLLWVPGYTLHVHNVGYASDAER